MWKYRKNTLYRLGGLKMIKIMDGKATSNKILEEESIKISKLSFKPKLVVISVGDDQASKVYIRNNTIFYKPYYSRIY